MNVSLNRFPVYRLPEWGLKQTNEVCQMRFHQIKYFAKKKNFDKKKEFSKQKKRFHQKRKNKTVK